MLSGKMSRTLLFKSHTKRKQGQSVDVEGFHLSLTRFITGCMSISLIQTTSSLLSLSRSLLALQHLRPLIPKRLTSSFTMTLRRSRSGSPADQIHMPPHSLTRGLRHFHERPSPQVLVTIGPLWMDFRLCSRTSIFRWVFF